MTTEERNVTAVAADKMPKSFKSINEDAKISSKRQSKMKEEQKV